MDLKTFRQTKVELHDSTGPCTSALNDYFRRSNGTSFFDYAFFHVDLFYLKYTQHIWHNQLRIPAEANSPIMREFKDKDMNLANECLYKFQALCDQEMLSTRNPISFFKDLDSYLRDAPKDFAAGAVLFLFATTDRGFLFDSAIQGSMPSIFITRAFIEKAKVSDNILLSSVFQHPQFSAKLEGRFEHIQDQIRYFHLMLPNRITYCDRWEKFTLPLVRKMQHMNRCYHENFNVDFSADDGTRNQLVNVVVDCVIWYMSTRRHLGIDTGCELEQSISYLQHRRNSPNGDKLTENIAKAVDTILGHKAVQAFPFFVFRMISKSYEKIKQDDVPNMERILSEIRLPLNLKYKTAERSSEQWNRWNLLLFRQICHRVGPLLPEGTVERSMYILEFSEAISMERYPSDELLELEPTDDRIKAYISKGENAGTAILPDVKEIVEYVAKNLEIAPFDILSYKAWNETPQSLREFMESSKGGKGSGRGRKQTKRKMLSEIITKLEDYSELKESYRHLVFEDESGYGSGIPTYEWAFQLGHLIDQVINKPEIQSALHTELTSSPELVELSIHQFFLSECVQEVKILVAVLGKRILYRDDVQELKIQPL